jgi:hypothetical protein
MTFPLFPLFPLFLCFRGRVRAKIIPRRHPPWPAPASARGASDNDHAGRRQDGRRWGEAAALRRFTNEAGRVFAVPVVFAAAWVHKLAEAVVSDFDVWLKRQGETL